MYYVTGLAGSIVSLVALIFFGTGHDLAFLGGSMAAIMWLSGAYLVWRADDITSRAVSERWAV